jgi:hypothetical protein
LLIVILLQKTSGGLYLHNWLHSQTNASPNTAPGLPVIIPDRGSCTCIDDFYIPFTETAEQAIQPIPVIETGFVAVLQFSFPSGLKIFHSLRGPPANMV